MGQFIKAKYAWMIPTQDGVIMEDNPDEPGMRPIYQIPVEDVKAFQEKWNMGTFKFVALYSGITPLPSPEVKTYKKRNERSK